MCVFGVSFHGADAVALHTRTASFCSPAAFSTFPSFTLTTLVSIFFFFTLCPPVLCSFASLELPLRERIQKRRAPVGRFSEALHDVEHVIYSQHLHVASLVGNGHLIRSRNAAVPACEREEQRPHQLGRSVSKASQHRRNVSGATLRLSPMSTCSPSGSFAVRTPSSSAFLCVMPCVVCGVRDAACPLSTRGGTRLVRLVRGEGRDLSG